MPKNKLFLLDAYALIYRAYYAFIKNPRVNSKGQNTSAIFGFVNTLEDVLKKENPSHIAVGFDPDGPTFRHTEFEAYKAQRQATPEDIKTAVPIIKKVLEAYNIPILEMDGYEADDVIGTIAKRVDKTEFDVYMMTPDKDYGQLTESHIFIYKPQYAGSGFDVLDDIKVMAKYNLSSPLQMIDYLGLMGDASDNIPGCPGVGPKTAEKLLQEFGSIENIIANTDKLKGSLRTKIEENQEQIVFSKFLATIKTDVPICIDPEQLIRKEIDEEKLKAIFEELEFRTLISRVLGVETPIKSQPAPTGQLELFGVGNEEQKTQQTELFSDVEISSNFDNINTISHDYKMVDTLEEMKSLAESLCKLPSICFDTETTGMDPITSDVVGLSFAAKEGEAYWVPISKDKAAAQTQIDIFRPIFENENIEKVGQNLKFDILGLKSFGVEVKGKLFDTMIAHYLISPESRHGMDYLAEVYLKYDTIHIDELIGAKGKNQLSMGDLNPADITDYACEDADVTLKLKNILAKELEENNLKKLFEDIECPLIYVLVDMEWNGVRLDMEALKSLSDELTKELYDIENEISKLAGIEFNINSPKQIGEVLFDRLKIVDKPKKTSTGQYKTSEDELEKLRNKHPIIEKILQQRGLRKLLSTYVDAFPQLVNPKTGKIHTSFNQTVAATGRLSSTNPNLQNIPIRDARGKEMRRVFIPDEGCTFVSADYSQIELRIMAHLSEDKNLVDAFNVGEDIHAATSAKIYNVPLEDVSSDMRRKAKTANFGIIYGISVFGLSERLNIPRAEAKELIDGYFATYPGVKRYMDESIEKAREKQYVETIYGRKRYVNDINSRNATVRGYAERNAINAPIQGSAADIIKIAMINIFNRLKRENLKSKMILQVHDELNLNVPMDEKNRVMQLVEEEMENACKLNVPLKTDCAAGRNWLEAH